MDLIDEEYQLEVEKRRQELTKVAATHGAALKRYREKLEKARKLEAIEKERRRKSREEIAKLRSEASELHAAVAKAAEAEKALLSGYVDRELVERRDSIRSKINQLERLKEGDLAHAGLFDLAIKQGSARRVKVPVPPRLKDPNNPPHKPEHVERPNPKRFTGPEAKEHLVKRKEEALLIAEEREAELCKLRPKLKQAQAALDAAIGEALRHG